MNRDFPISKKLAIDLNGLLKQQVVDVYEAEGRIEMKRFATALLALLFMVSCTQSEINLINALVTGAEILLPLFASSGFNSEVNEYVQQTLPIVDSVLANPTALNEENAAIKLAQIVVPKIDSRMTQQQQQALANFILLVNSVINAAPQPSSASARVQASVTPKISKGEAKQIAEIRGRILRLEGK